MLEIKVDSRDNLRPMSINSRIVSEICQEINLDIQGVLAGYQFHYAYRMSIVKLLLRENVQDEPKMRRNPFPLNNDLEVIYVRQAGNQEVTLVALGVSLHHRGQGHVRVCEEVWRTSGGRQFELCERQARVL